MQYKYISDLHLFDVYSLDWRDNFPTLEAYAMCLIENWNAFTEPDDVVILVGDVGHYCPKTLEVLRRLKGTIILVKGNHDVVWGSDLYTCGLFKGIHDEINSTGLFVKHIPDEPQGLSKYYIHGHHHRYDMPGMLGALKLYAGDVYRLNCAADLNNHRPCTIQELILNKELMIEDFRERGLLTGG